MGYQERRRVPHLSRARRGYGKHLITCPQCQLGDDSRTTSCLKGAARYASLTAALDSKFPELFKASPRLHALFIARLDFAGHSVACRHSDDCSFCLELWTRVVALMQPGD